MAMSMKHDSRSHHQVCLHAQKDTSSIKSAVAGLESVKLAIPGQFGWEATCGWRAGLHHLHYISISNSTPYILLTWKQRLCEQQ